MAATTLHLPEDLIVCRILTKLPVKSLLRFKSVSKSWCSTIRHPWFARTHLNHCLANNSPNGDRFPLIIHFVADNDVNRGIGFSEIIDYKEEELKVTKKSSDSEWENVEAKTSDFSFPFSMMGEFSVRCVCDGILSLDSQGRHYMMLWNPCTGKYKTLKTPSDSKIATHGFGYVSSINDYKVVRVHKNSGVVEVLTLKSKSYVWKRVSEIFPLPLAFYSKPMSVNGAIYWITNQPIPSIISFDLSEEKFMEVIPPRDIVKQGIQAQRCELGVLNGCLCIFNHVWFLYLEIWALNKGNGEVDNMWTELVRVPWPDGEGNETINSMKPLYLAKNGDIFILFECGGYNQLESERYRLGIYKPEQTKFKELRLSYYLLSTDVIIYEGSLVSPCEENETECEWHSSDLFDLYTTEALQVFGHIPI